MYSISIIFLIIIIVGIGESSGGIGSWIMLEDASINKGKWVSGSRTRVGNNKQVTFLEESNFLGKWSGDLELNHPTNTGQKATMLGRISFKKRSQQ